LPAVVVCAAAFRQAAPPATEVYLAPLSIAGGHVTVGTPVNISNDPDYDNQPIFLPDSSAILFTSRRDGKQTDIYRYDLKTKKVTQLTHTPENEYSPLVTPDGKTFSTVRGDKQELWRFDLDGTNPRLAYAHKGLIGYHVWIDDHRLAVFVLGANGAPATLQLVDTTAGTAEVIESNIGRSLLMRPGHKTVSYVSKAQSGAWVIKQLAPASRETTTITETIKGSEDLTWLPEDIILMGQGTKLFASARGVIGATGGMAAESRSWTEVADLASAGLTRITRLAASPDGKWLALVAEPAPK
jgi:Tol biopolymer transport system component